MNFDFLLPRLSRIFASFADKVSKNSNKSIFLSDNCDNCGKSKYTYRSLMLMSDAAESQAEAREYPTSLYWEERFFLVEAFEIFKCNCWDHRSTVFRLSKKTVCLPAEGGKANGIVSFLHSFGTESLLVLFALTILRSLSHSLCLGRITLSCVLGPGSRHCRSWCPVSRV